MSNRTHYSKIGTLEAQSMERLVQALLGATNPAEAIVKAIENGKTQNASAFERYASSLLERAGGQKLASAPQRKTLKILEPENGRLAQIVHSGSCPSSLETILLATECALNRLVCLADAVTDGRSEQEPVNEAPRRSISILGGGYLGTNAGWRSARIVLPDPNNTDGINERYYNEVDWRSTDCVASNARAIFQSSLRPNPYRTKLGVNVSKQSDWDVRTRLAQIFRALELPHRYSFRFDYDAASQAVAAVFTCPPPGFLPEIQANGKNTRIPSLKEAAYQGYLLRLGCLFCAACFGGGREIELATVVGYDSTWGKPLVSLQFNRSDFVRSVLVRIDADELSDPALRFDPRSIANMAYASHLDWLGRAENADDGLASVPSTGIGFTRIAPWLDERPLAKDAQALFHCKRICDVDTSHYYGGHGDAVDLARNDSDDSPLSAIVRLESLVDDLEASLSAPKDSVSARPLYAPDPLSRLAIGLLDDDMTIAEQAQAYLQGNLEALPDEHDLPCYFRAPSALYHAHFGLSCLYQELKDFSTAQFHADRCMALAPTSAASYYRKADVLAEQGYFSQAANVIITGLNYATNPPDCSMLYFHLSMLLWNMGEKEKAAAVHAYNASLKGEYSDKSKRILEGLRNQPDTPDSAHVKPYAASRLLAQMHLPVAPVNMRHYIAPATITLANSGSPEAAAPYARLLERQHNNDEVVVAACRSLQLGITI